MSFGPYNLFKAGVTLSEHSTEGESETAAQADADANGTATYQIMREGEVVQNIPPPPPSGSVLADLSVALLPGEHAPFTKNLHNRVPDIKWMTKPLYHDPVRGELQYLGKPQSGYSLDWKHYIYDEASDTWSDEGVIYNSQGHTWLTTMDPQSGDLFWHNGSGETIVHRYSRATDSHSSISLPGSNGEVATLAFHPNLFGPGIPGIFIWGGNNFYAFNLTSNTLVNIGPNPGGPTNSTTARIKNGTGDYCAARDSVVCGGKDNNSSVDRKPIVEALAGAGNSSDCLAEGTVVYKGEAPVVIYGSNSTHGKLIADPGDPTKILVLEGFGTARVWESADGGATWTENGTHPFEAELSPTDGGHFMIGRAYDVIIGMSSGSGGGDALIWKPNN